MSPLELFHKYFELNMGQAKETANGTINIISNSKHGYCGVRKGVNFSQLPVKFGEVDLTLWFNGGGLTTLIGSPTHLGGNFHIDGNKLTSLEHCPQHIGGGLYCNDNQLTSLQHCPNKIRGLINCSNNQLTSLEGGPSRTWGSYWCYNNPLISLKGLADNYKSFMATYTPDLPVLSLLKNSGDIVLVLPEDSNKRFMPVIKILKKHRKASLSRSDILACQKELIDNGFEGNAKW